MIYLDNAATSYPKPRRVIEEQTKCMSVYGGNPGRGSHRLSLLAAERVYACREAVAELMGSQHPENVIFTMNTTMAINLAVKGLLRKGDHVLISDMEHNAVWRPIYRLAKDGVITYELFPTHENGSPLDGDRLCREIVSRIRPDTRMLITAHSSNVVSTRMPLGRIGRLCRDRGILFVVDAAQSAGHLPICMEEMCIDALCAPGHKGLLGPQGSGFLLLSEGVEAETLWEGGSGLHSLEPNMPEESPERYEAGTLPTPAIAGLLEGIRFLRHVGLEEISAREEEWCRLMRERLLDLSGVTVYGGAERESLLLFSSERLPSEELGRELDSRGFCVRAGFHCAALAHRTIGTPPSGAVRISPGYFTPKTHADLLWNALREILG